MSGSKSLRQDTPELQEYTILRQDSNTELQPLHDDSSKITLQGPVGPEGGIAFEQEVQNRINRGETTSGMWYLSEYEEKARKPTWHDRQEELITIATFLFLNKHTFEETIRRIKKLVPNGIKLMARNYFKMRHDDPIKERAFNGVNFAIERLNSRTRQKINENYKIFLALWNSYNEREDTSLIYLLTLDLPTEEDDFAGREVLKWDDLLNQINQTKLKKFKKRLSLLGWVENPPSDEETKLVARQFINRANRLKDLKIINKNWLQLVDILENDFIKKNRVRLTASDTASAVAEGAKCIGKKCAVVANTAVQKLGKIFSRKKKESGGGKKKKTRRKSPFKKRRSKKRVRGKFSSTKRKKTRRKKRKRRKKN